jgi:flagellar L-ring protein precursor FlgH
VVAVDSVGAQNSSLYQSAPLATDRLGPDSLDRGSWTYIPVPPPKKIRLHELVQVRVDELTRTTSEGDVQRRRDAQYDAVIQNWIDLIGLKAIKRSPQNDGDPQITGQLQQLYRAQAEIETRESVAFNIACQVADIRPNGNLVLEGHRQIRVNDESWELSLSGICRREDIGPDNLVLSRNIVGLKIDKRERGHVRDGYKRGWLLRWVDEFHPF